MRRSYALALAVAFGLAALAYFEGVLKPRRAVEESPTADASWIWARDAEASAGWVDFFLFRDFDIATSTQSARLLIQADEHYWVFLNGRAVGSGGVSAAGSLDSYEVGGLLRQGANRILVEVASRRGVGGLLASIDLGEARPLGTDGSWKSARWFEPALYKPGFVAEDQSPVEVWGRPPVGSWEIAQEPIATALLAEQLVQRAAVEPVRIRELGSRDWQRRFPAVSERVALGRWVSFDLGREVEGYANVVFAERFGARGLVYFGRSRAHGPSSADPDHHFLAPSGRGSWTAPRPGAFRFVTVLSDAPVTGLRIFETRSEWTVARLGSPRSTRAFSLEPPPSASTVEDEFWRELKRLTGLTGREAFESLSGG